MAEEDVFRDATNLDVMEHRDFEGLVIEERVINEEQQQHYHSIPMALKIKQYCNFRQEVLQRLPCLKILPVYKLWQR